MDDVVEAAARRDEVRAALTRDLESAGYVADRAFRQCDAADPANRLVAAELEARWEAALEHQREAEAKLSVHDAAGVGKPDSTPVSFATLARDLRSVWNAPSTDARLRKRIVRTVVHDVVADIDEDAANGDGEVVLVVHWAGGVHTELRLPRRRGRRNSVPLETIRQTRAGRHRRRDGQRAQQQRTAHRQRQHLRHVAEAADGRWLALLGWPAGAFKAGARDAWRPEQQSGGCTWWRTTRAS